MCGDETAEPLPNGELQDKATISEAKNIKIGY